MHTMACPRHGRRSMAKIKANSLPPWLLGENVPQYSRSPRALLRGRERRKTERKKEITGEREMRRVLPVKTFEKEIRSYPARLFLHLRIESQFSVGHPPRLENPPKLSLNRYQKLLCANCYGTTSIKERIFGDVGLGRRKKLNSYLDRKMWQKKSTLERVIRILFSLIVTE